MGQVLPPDSFVVPYTRPMDPEGERGQPCSTTLETPRGWVARVNTDNSLVMIQLEARRLPPVTRKSRIASFLPVPLEGWRPGLAPNAITNF